ncbi:MAG: DUF1883 domain-containing protein [Thermoguttaceae bacterium]
MKYLHWEMNAGSENVIAVELSRAANVLLLDDANYNSYRCGSSYRYHGGHAKQTPVRLVPPRSGHWHVVVDLGGYGGQVDASVSVL